MARCAGVDIIPVHSRIVGTMTKELLYQQAFFASPVRTAPFLLSSVRCSHRCRKGVYRWFPSPMMENACSTPWDKRSAICVAWRH